MLTAKDIMSKNVITVSPDTDVAQAARLLLENHINGIPVVDPSGKVLGILCQSDPGCTTEKTIPSIAVYPAGWFYLFNIHENSRKGIQKNSRHQGVRGYDIRPRHRNAGYRP